MSTDNHETDEARLSRADMFTCIFLCVEVVVGVIPGCLLRLVYVVRRVRFEWPGDSWDVGQVGRRTSQR